MYYDINKILSICTTQVDGKTWSHLHCEKTTSRSPWGKRFSVRG